MNIDLDILNCIHVINIVIHTKKYYQELGLFYWIALRRNVVK